MTKPSNKFDIENLWRQILDSDVIQTQLKPSELLDKLSMPNSLVAYAANYYLNEQTPVPNTKRLTVPLSDASTFYDKRYVSELKKCIKAQLNEGVIEIEGDDVIINVLFASNGVTANESEVIKQLQSELKEAEDEQMRLISCMSQFESYFGYPMIDAEWFVAEQMF